MVRPILAFLILAAATSCGRERLRKVDDCEVPSNLEKPEICNDRDDNCNCPGDTNRDGTVCGAGDTGVDEKCDDDRDGYCSATATIEGHPSVCPKSFDFCTDPSSCYVTALDCDDGNAAVNPGAKEICDGRDNNCNGKTDTDDRLIDDARLGQECADPATGSKLGVGECRAGRDLCVGGAVLCQGAKGPEGEICDGKDNDCNGLVDDGAHLYKPCWSPANPLVGACHPGFQLCTNGGYNAACTGEALPTAETCNGLDDDCDGKVDDGARGSGDPLYVMFHLDCSGSMSDKITEIRNFLNNLNQLPSIYQSPNIRYALVLHPDMNVNRPWVHQAFTDLNAFRTSLSSADLMNCGWLEPNVDTVAFGLCSSRPIAEWGLTHRCRTLYDAEWNRCGGPGGTLPSSHPAGSICRSILTGGYAQSRMFDLPVPDGAGQLHVLFTDEDPQTNNGLVPADVRGIENDLKAKYSASGWTAKIKTACFLNASYASAFSPMCDSSYTMSSSTTSSDLMTNFTLELQVQYCQ